MNWADWADEQTPESSSSANWLSQLGGFVGNAGQAAGNILNGLRGKTANSTTGLQSPTNWTPFLLVGGALALVVVIVVAIRK